MHSLRAGIHNIPRNGSPSKLDTWPLHSFSELFCCQFWRTLCKTRVIHHSKDYANVCTADTGNRECLLLACSAPIRGIVFFISYCYIRERLDRKTDNSRECMSITKVAKLDFQVVAFGHLSPIDTTQRRHHVSRWLMYLTRLKIPRAFSFFFEPPLSPCCPFLFFFILIRSTLLPLITYISIRS